MKVEVCAESVESAITAAEAGAFRIEFCDNMAEGGTTPSAGQIAEARERLKTLKIYPIIRPRGSDFCYSDAEMGVMRRDVELCGQLGCDGVVIGILREDGTVDTARCAELIAIARKYNMGITFHRAFDVSASLERSLEDIIALGCERVLTSGGAATALEGVSTLKKLVEQAAERITIMAGSGVTPENAGEIIAKTGVMEIHGTFRSRLKSPLKHPQWADYERFAADFDTISKVVAM